MAKLTEGGTKKLPAYKPLHGSETDGSNLRPDGEDYAGYGPTDGVQSEGSAKEADRLLAYNMNKKTGDYNVKSSASRARYSECLDED